MVSRGNGVDMGRCQPSITVNGGGGGSMVITEPYGGIR